MKDSHFEETNLKGHRFFYLPFLEKEGIFHGFSTRLEVNVKEFFAGFNFILMDQEHGDEIHLIRNGERPEKGDGLVLLEKEVFGIIKTADCLPAILYEPSLPLVSIVHAGWRGTMKKILKKAILMMEELGAKREKIVALLGPSIGGCCYEVGEEIVRLFLSEGFDKDIFARRGKRFFLDLKMANRFLIRGIGKIYDLSICTYCNPHILSSARRGDGERQINFVCIRR